MIPLVKDVFGLDKLKLREVLALEIMNLYHTLCKKTSKRFTEKLRVNTLINKTS